MSQERGAGWASFARGALLLAGAGAVVLQALALMSAYFPVRLSSDYIYPHLFAQDVLTGVYPLSGWTLSSAPYFFPDFAGYAAWLVAVGSNGAAFAGYVSSVYLALGFLFGWSLRRAGAGRDAWLLGWAAMSALLLLHLWRDHAHVLWWLGTPGFHGGAVVLALATFACWVGPLDELPSAAARVGGTALLVLGLCSDTLYFVQGVVPLAVALMLESRRTTGHFGTPRVRSYLTAVGLALVGWGLFRATCAAMGIFTFSKVLRYVPTPEAWWRTFGLFWSDLTGPLARDQPALIAIALAATAYAAVAAWGSRRLVPGSPSPTLLPDAFAVLALGAALALPILAVYWKDQQSARYLLPWLVLPLWWGAWRWLAVRRSSAAQQAMRWGCAGVIAASLVIGLIRWEPEGWTWPRPAAAQTLEQELRSRGHTRGLGDYWNTHYLNVLTELRLTALRPSSQVQFWNNNAAWHWDAADGQLVEPPPYTFIITTRLDEAQLEARFGQPDARVELAGEQVWLFDAPAAREMSARIDADIRLFLEQTPAARALPAQ